MELSWFPSILSMFSLSISSTLSRCWHKVVSNSPLYPSNTGRVFSGNSFFIADAGNVCFFFFPLAEGVSVLFVFSNNHLLALLIFWIVYCLFHWLMPFFVLSTFDLLCPSFSNLFFIFLWPHLQHMEVPGLAVKSNSHLHGHYVRFLTHWATMRTLFSYLLIQDFSASRSSCCGSAG